jgi:hypothetical protein
MLILVDVFGSFGFCARKDRSIPHSFELKRPRPPLRPARLVP